MATYKQIGYGSQGSDVTELQKLLNKNGYTLDEDGKFGPKTQSAVSTPSDTTPSGTTGATTPPQDTGFKYSDYQVSDTVKQAEELLRQQLAQKPGSYMSPWQSQLNDVIQKIMNREEFSYDLNGDALYQQYKDKATTQGQMAMMDTMGEAAALTGGYSNSYAQNVGQQAYQGHLQQLNDIVPELYQLAMNQYNQEVQEMKDQASMLGAMEEQEYGRYRDQVSDYNSELGRLTEDARYQGEKDYGMYLDGYNKAYGEYRDAEADKQWQAEFDEAKRQYDQQYALASGGSSGGSSSGGGGNRNWDNQGYSSSVVKLAQDFLGMDDVDGYWGKNSAAAAQEEGYSSLADVIAAMNGGTPDEEPTAITADTVSDEMDEMIRNGAPKSTINAQLRDHLKAGHITQEEYNKLKETYAPRGNTY